MRRMTFIALLTAISLCIFIIEAQIPLPVPFPGVKCGLSNIIVLVTMILLDKKAAFSVLFLKIVLSSCLLGLGLGTVYSFLGGALAFLVMLLLLKPLKNYIWVISTLGAVAHNTGQIIAAVIFMGKVSLAYYPVLVISGIITGAFTGIISQSIILKSSYINKLFSELGKGKK